MIAILFAISIVAVVCKLSGIAPEIPWTFATIGLWMPMVAVLVVVVLQHFFETPEQRRRRRVRAAFREFCEPPWWRR